MAIAKRTILISGSAETLKEVARILPPKFGTLTRRDDVLYELNHPSFYEKDRAQLEADTTILLERMTGLLHVNQPLGARKLWIGHMLETNEAGRNTVTKTFHLTVIPQPALDLLETDSRGVSRCERLLQLAEEDERVHIALRLLRDDRCDWENVYDVIEFLESHAKISGLGWISKNRLDLISGHANYPRHQGKAGNKKPEKEEKLLDAIIEVLGLLRRWLEQRLSEADASRVTSTSNPSG